MSEKFIAPNRNSFTIRLVIGAVQVRVAFRLSFPGVKAGGAVVFIPALAIFAIPDILGGPNDTMIGNLIKTQFLETRDWPFGSVLSIALTIAALLLAGVAAWVGRRGARGARG